MDDLIRYIFASIYNWIKTKRLIYLYSKRGIKNHSFVDHAIALCYEQESEGQMQRNKSGEGDIVFETPVSDHIHISCINGNNNIELLEAAVFDFFDRDYADSLAAEMSKAYPDFYFPTQLRDDGKEVMDIGCKMEANVSEKDARYYINGFIDELLTPKRQEIIRKYNKYKQSKNKV